MKPLGPIPPGFAMIDGELAIGTRTASALVAEAGQTPLFVYSAAMIRRAMCRGSRVGASGPACDA